MRVIPYNPMKFSSTPHYTVAVFWVTPQKYLPITLWPCSGSPLRSTSPSRCGRVPGHPSEALPQCAVAVFPSSVSLSQPFLWPSSVSENAAASVCCVAGRRLFRPREAWAALAVALFGQK